MNTPVTVFTTNLLQHRINSTAALGKWEQMVTVAGVRYHANVAPGKCMTKPLFSRHNGDVGKSLTVAFLFVFFLPGKGGIYGQRAEAR